MGARRAAGDCRPYLWVGGVTRGRGLRSLPLEGRRVRSPWRNGDAVAPERRCRCAGTAMPLRRNGGAVAPERRYRCAGTAARAKTVRNGLKPTNCAGWAEWPRSDSRGDRDKSRRVWVSFPREVTCQSKCHQSTPMGRGERPPAFEENVHCPSKHPYSRSLYMGNSHAEAIFTKNGTHEPVNMV